MKIDIPGLDAESGLDVCGGNQNIYQYTLGLYVSEIPPFLNKIRAVSKETNISAEILHDYAISVHSVKGMSKYVGAVEIIKTAELLQALAKDGDTAGILDHNDTFIEHLEKLLSDIKNWLNQNKVE